MNCHNFVCVLEYVAAGGLLDLRISRFPNALLLVCLLTIFIDSDNKLTYFSLEPVTARFNAPRPTDASSSVLVFFVRQGTICLFLLHSLSHFTSQSNATECQVTILVISAELCQAISDGANLTKHAVIICVCCLTLL